MATERFGWFHSLALICVSFCLLPVSTYILFSTYTLQALLPRFSTQRLRYDRSKFRPRRVLISGVNTASGLALARAFYSAGHTVVGADCEVNHVPGIGRVSRAVKNFHTLPIPKNELGTTEYVHALLQAIEKEKADLWISCSAFTSSIEDALAKEVIERKTKCRCLGFDLATTTLLSNSEEFLRCARSMGLPALEAYKVTSRNAVHRVLGSASTPGRSFTISKVRSRHTEQGPLGETLPVLPRRSVSETYQLVSEMSISQEMPHILEEDVKGEEYITHAMVIRGSVEAFAACVAPDRYMQLHGLPMDSGLCQAMLKFTHEFVNRFEHELTGHISFAFKVEQSSSEKGYEHKLIPMACNPKVEVPSILLRSANRDLAHTTLSVLDEPMLNGYLKSTRQLTVPEQALAFHWSGLNLILMAILPAVEFLHGRVELVELFGAWSLFIRGLCFYKDMTFEMWDPFPWWWQYHVYWPAQLLHCVLRQQKWSFLDMDSGRVYE